MKGYFGNVVLAARIAAQIEHLPATPDQDDG